jgi:nucleoid-associated protein YgaU
VRYAILLVSLVGLVGWGCQKKATSSIPTNDSVTDIGGTTAHPVHTPPAAPQPVVYDSMHTQPVTGDATGAAESYTIQKGDTLYSIARQRYGDGKDWQRIASANPGIDPTKLRVGQTINIP